MSSQAERDARHDTRLDDEYGYLRAPGKTVILVVEGAGVTPTGDE